MIRVRALISTVRPSASWAITNRLASQARRWDVPAGTCWPSSRTDCRACSGSASTGAYCAVSDLPRHRDADDAGQDDGGARQAWRQAALAQHERADEGGEDDRELAGGD